MIYFGYDTFLGCFALLLLVYYYVTTKYNYWKVRGVKGPAPLPIIGNFGRIILGKISLADFLKEIYNRYSEEPLIGIYSGFQPILVVRDPTFIKDVLIKDFSNFADRKTTVNEKTDTFAANLFSVEARRWRLLRAKLSPTFSSGKLKDMFYLLTQCSNNFGQYLDRLISREEILDCREITSKFTADVIGTCVFGLDLNTLNDKDCKFLRIASRMMKPSMKRYIKESLKEMLPSVYGIIGRYFIEHDINDFFIRTVMDVIEYRWKNKIVKHDFVDILLDLKKRPEKHPELELTDNVIVAQAVAFFIAGFFASSLTMSHILYQLALNPDIQKRLRVEIADELERNGGRIDYESFKTMNYLDAIFKEILRKYPPVTHLMRSALVDYTFAGTQVRIPKGQEVWIPVYPIHLDPKMYPDPLKFDPERFQKDNNIGMTNSTVYLAFGDGPRNCIGARFAIYQTKVGVVEILRNFEINVCEKTNFEYRKQTRSFILAPKEGTYLKFTKINRG